MNNHNELTAGEDLFREHGLLDRLLLIYEEIVRRLENNIRIGDKVIYYTAYIIKHFVEKYHEKTEEKYVFPLLKQHNIAVHIINQLLIQHQQGRQITNKILELSKNNNIPDKHEIIFNIKEYIKMYRLHSSREDTIIFPEFIKLLNKQEYEKYSKIFEEDEKIKLGPKGFKTYLESVEALEKYLNIYDIAQITKEFNSKIYHK